MRHSRLLCGRLNRLPQHLLAEGTTPLSTLPSLHLLTRLHHRTINGQTRTWRQSASTLRSKRSTSTTKSWSSKSYLPPSPFFQNADSSFFSLLVDHVQTATLLTVHTVFPFLVFFSSFSFHVSVGHGWAGTFPHHHLVLLSRRARHHPRVRLHRGGVVQQRQAMAQRDRPLCVRERQQAARLQQDRPCRPQSRRRAHRDRVCQQHEHPVHRNVSEERGQRWRGVLHDGEVYHCEVRARFSTRLQHTLAAPFPLSLHANSRSSRCALGWETKIPPSSHMLSIHSLAREVTAPTLLATHHTLSTGSGPPRSRSKRSHSSPKRRRRKGRALFKKEYNKICCFCLHRAMHQEPLVTEPAPSPAENVFPSRVAHWLTFRWWRTVQKMAPEHHAGCPGDFPLLRLCFFAGARLRDGFPGRVSQPVGIAEPASAYFLGNHLCLQFTGCLRRRLSTQILGTSSLIWWPSLPLSRFLRYGSDDVLNVSSRLH